MSDGDVGRLLLMWKSWSVKMQGIKGLSHYSRYLPRLIRLLTKVLPKSLSHVILHTLLISPTGRHGHFVAKDFHLEIKNYWLKYFYNHAGPGTDIERLKETFSLTVGLLSHLVNTMKGRAGQNNVRQSRKNRSTPTSMIRFLNMARSENITKSKPNSETVGKPLGDIHRLGIQKLKVDFGKQQLERFHWPVASNYSEEQGDMRNTTHLFWQASSFASSWSYGILSTLNQSKHRLLYAALRALASLSAFT
ncbi:uncharacterized protein MELLADRAFT_90247 [Melampsora larici-populina 98AG31]|uniref:DUF6589 domain-containing protein n=1 Tax=Melampsora larici-populina (strain 98AG31 / pathotype 3-4-7) TaxID=747676 RepID=F4RW91_MELLP|nr:uncharacterized protein MELLADRAFT_90247 [Melampsora larici-populina 98AG31]EGG03361.1 hypothetical protein MELLADRAFT_90247 [Melampsora larici-populina 98AG31]